MFHAFPFLRLVEAAGQRFNVTTRTAPASDEAGDHPMEGQQQRSGNARRLKESCLADSECNHDNEHARCLDFVCLCPAHFYTSADSSLCLPDSATWQPLRAVMFPAVLLILAFVILGVFGYKRCARGSPGCVRWLNAPNNDKAALQKDCSPTTKDHSSHCFNSIRKWMKGPRISRLWPYSRPFADNESLQECYFPEFWQDELEKIALRNSFHRGSVGDSTRLELASQCATFDPTNAQSPFTRSPLQLASQEFEPALSDGRALYRSAPAGGTGNSKRIFKSRARPFTVLKSANTFRSAHQRTNFTAATSSVSSRFNVSNPSFFPDNRVTNLRDTVQQETTSKRASVPECERNWTVDGCEMSAQHYERFSGKCKSETLLRPTINRLRRAMSENRSPTMTVVKKRAVSFSKGYHSPVAPIQRRTESCADSPENSVERGVASKARTHRPQNWLLAKFLRKRFGRRIRSCETTAMYDGASRDTTKATVINSKQDGSTKENRKTPSIPSRWPPSGVAMHFHRLPFDHGFESTAPESPTAQLSTSAAQYEAAPSGSSCSSNSACYFNPGFLGDSPENTVGGADYRDPQLSTPLRFHSGPHTPDSALAAAMLRAERRVKVPMWNLRNTHLPSKRLTQQRMMRPWNSRVRSTSPTEQARWGRVHLVVDEPTVGATWSALRRELVAAQSSRLFWSPTRKTSPACHHDA
ncbi:uncharacterized protein LOC144098722 isoform X3 [Amblyomma americanum]